MRRVYAVLIGLVFTVTGIAADQKPPTEEQLEKWFNDLTPSSPLWPSSDRSEVVLRGVFSLIDHPKEAVPFLRKKLKVADGPEEKLIDGWVKDYLGDDAKARDAAEVELRKHHKDYLVEQKLLKAGQATDSQPLRYRVLAVVRDEPRKEPKDGEYLPNINFASPEVARLLRGSNPPRRGPFLPVEAHQHSPHYETHHRTRRALLVLERIGTPEAVEVLRVVAGGREGLPATAAAKEALERVKAK